MLFSTLILGIFVELMEKLSVENSYWHYKSFLKKLKNAITVNSMYLRGVMNEVIKIVCEIYYKPELITRELLPSAMTDLSAKLKTLKHKQLFWFLQHNPSLVALYRAAELNHKEEVMITFLVTQFERYDNIPQMRKIDDSLIKHHKDALMSLNIDAI